MTAKVVITVLPHEERGELEEKIRLTVAARKPRDPLEHELICRAVKLSWEIDRADRIATAHLAHKVRMAARLGSETGNVSAEEVKRVHELGGRLFFVSAIGPGYDDRNPEDYPAVIVHRLEETAAGCRWLLDRWAEMLNVIRCRSAWGEAEIVRLLALMAKRGIEAHFDPQLNSLFHSFDALSDQLGQKFWYARRDKLPVGYIGGLEYSPYRGFAPPPGNESEAMVVICEIIKRHVGRLEALLAEHHAIKADEVDERYDRAALDDSPGLDRHRRNQSARHREQMQVLEALRKMRAEPVEEGVAAEQGVASGQWSVVSESGGSGEREPGESQSPFVGQDSNLVLDDQEDDKIGILSHEGRGATEQAASMKTRENAHNEANFESTESSTGDAVVVSEAGNEAGKRSQNAPAKVYFRTGVMPSLMRGLIGGS